ncbi:MAG TPA: hypothetical protein VKZ82_27320 [Nonomuraea sp.]|nr:hypothetical protein [Nocardia farcinica]HLU75917.1 hypothetical protein [Nonomuraea sp.]
MTTTQDEVRARWAAARLRILLAVHGGLYTRRRTRRCISLPSPARSRSK